MPFIGSVGGWLINIMSTFIFWIILGLVVFGGGFAILAIKKRRKLIYTAIEFTDAGAGKQIIEIHKAGWFRRNCILFGLLDWSGEQVLKLKDGREIQGGSSEDFHQIKGQRGLLLVRKPDDPDILILLPKMKLDDEAEVMLSSIAPGDFRDASNKIMENNNKETMSKFEKLLPAIILGTMAIILLISIIIITQMVKQGQTEASNLIRDAPNICKAIWDGLVTEGTSYIASTAP